MESKYPKISVLMPVYNAEKYLREAMDSILNQTFKDFEFIIINDASVDSSKNIILSYNDKRIRYFENDNNLGVARTLNRGLKLAKSDLIARMDADDISFPNRLEMQYKMMERDKEIAVLASIFDVVDECGKFLYTEKYANSPEEIYYTLRFRDCLGHPTVMFKKRMVLDVFNGYDINHEAEDFDLWLRISSTYKISKINTSLLKLRISKKSRMGAMGGKINDDAVFIAKKNLELLTGKKISLDIIEILRRNFASFGSSLSTVFSKEEIRRALIILEKINNEIINHHPIFLKKSILEKILIKKFDSLKHDLCLATLFDFKFGFLLRNLFRVYFFFKLNLIRGFQSQE
jgi:glycosyltransferase involved in cell wall biosynthesis